MEPVIRKSLRRSDHEYDRSNVYFITIRTFESARLLGKITEDGLHVFESGMMVRHEWMAVSNRFAGVEPGLLVVMPDYVHGVLVIDGKDGQRQALPNPLGGFVGHPASRIYQRDSGGACVGVFSLAAALSCAPDHCQRLHPLHLDTRAISDAFDPATRHHHGRQ